MKTKIILFLIILIFLFSFGYIVNNAFNKDNNYKEDYNKAINEVVFKTDSENIAIQAEIARTLEEISKGLMQRERLGEYSGMLFVFPDESQRSFWMKNTLINLDIVFISKGKKIVSIAEAVPCPSKNTKCPLYKSEVPAQYVVEVNGGFCEEHNIKKGDLVEF